MLTSETWQAGAQAKAECDQLLESKERQLVLLRKEVAEKDTFFEKRLQEKEEEVDSVRSSLANRGSTIDRLGDAPPPILPLPTHTREKLCEKLMLTLCLRS